MLHLNHLSTTLKNTDVRKDRIMVRFVANIIDDPPAFFNHCQHVHQYMPREIKSVANSAKNLSNNSKTSGDNKCAKTVEASTPNSATWKPMSVETVAADIDTMTALGKYVNILLKILHITQLVWRN